MAVLFGKNIVGADIIRPLCRVLTKNQKTFDTIFILILILWIGFNPFNFKIFNEIAEDILKNAGADSVSVGSVSAVLSKGVRISDVSIYKQINRHEFYRAEISRIDIACNPFSLLFSRNALLSDRDIFMELNDKPLELAAEAANFVNTLKFIKKIELRNANLRFQERNRAGIRVENISARFFRRQKRFLGSVSADEAVIPSLVRIENFEIKLRLNKNRLDLFDGSGDIFDGKLNLELSVDLDENSIVGGNLSVRELCMKEAVVKINLLQGSIDGRVNIDAIFEPSAFSVDEIKLDGSFSATEVVARDLALQRISLLRRIPQIRTLEFTEIDGNFVFSGGLKNGRIHFNEMAGRGEAMIFSSSGWFRLNGRMQKTMDGEMSRKFIDELPNIMRNSFEISENGKGRFKCSIGGTFDNPQVKIERAMVRNAMRNTFGSGRRRRDR